MGAITVEESASEERKERSTRCGAEGEREDEGTGANVYVNVVLESDIWDYARLGNQAGLSNLRFLPSSSAPNFFSLLRQHQRRCYCCACEVGRGASV